MPVCSDVTPKRDGLPAVASTKEPALRFPAFFRPVYWSIVCGLVLGLVALLAAGLMPEASPRNSLKPVTSTAPVASTPTAIRPLRQGRLTFYVVDSEERAGQLREQAQRSIPTNADGVTGVPVNGFTVVVVTSDAEELTARNSYRELAEIWDVDFVDLRGR